MSRIKSCETARKRHKKILKMAKGYRGARSRRYKSANEAVIHALTYAYNDRRLKKREYRQLWIARINAAARANGLSYNKLICGLKKAGIQINRKMLSYIAINDFDRFSSIVHSASHALDS